MRNEFLLVCPVVHLFQWSRVGGKRNYIILKQKKPSSILKCSHYIHVFYWLWKMKDIQRTQTHTFKRIFTHFWECTYITVCTRKGPLDTSDCISVLHQKWLVEVSAHDCIMHMHRARADCVYLYWFSEFTSGNALMYVQGWTEYIVNGIPFIWWV